MARGSPANGRDVARGIDGQSVWSGTRRQPRVDIAPSIADHKTSPQVNSPTEGSIPEETRLGFAAAARLGVVVEAHAELVDGQRGAQSGVHRLHSRLTPRAPSHFGLIGDKPL